MSTTKNVAYRPCKLLRIFCSYYVGYQITCEKLRLCGYFFKRCFRIFILLQANVRLCYPIWNLRVLFRYFVSKGLFCLTTYKLDLGIWNAKQYELTLIQRLFPSLQLQRTRGHVQRYFPLQLLHFLRVIISVHVCDDQQCLKINQSVRVNKVKANNC